MSEKCQVTVTLSYTATGNMLPPMVIFKGTTPRSICGVNAEKFNIRKKLKS